MSVLLHLSIYCRSEWYGSTANLPHATPDSVQYDRFAHLVLIKTPATLSVVLNYDTFLSTHLVDSN